MLRLADEITSADRAHSLGVRPLSVEERDALRDRVRGRYGGGTGRMWERLSECASMQDSDGWRWISRFVGSRPCILLFDADEEVEMFEVPSGEALERLLEATTGFEFYVTDVGAAYLLCFNHHDVLLGCGSARGWLEALSRDR